MIKIISTERYKRLLSDNELLKNDNKLLTLILYDVICGYDDMTYLELSKMRKQKTLEVRNIDARMKNICASVGKSTSGGGGYKK